MCSPDPDEPVPLVKREAASELRARGATTGLTVGDVAETDTAERAVHQALGTWGRIDILVNNAGIGGRG